MGAVILRDYLAHAKCLSIGAEVMLEMLGSALSSELDLVGHKPELPTFSKLIFCQLPPPRSFSAQTSSHLSCVSAHNVSTLIINDMHKNCV